MADHITPATKVAELLDRWPELEPVLVAQAPAFQKLRNPVLRRTIARVATLEQAAGIAGLSPRDLVATLRRAAGQPLDDDTPAGTRAPAAPPVHPCALPRAGTVSKRDATVAALQEGASVIDADVLLESGSAPLAPVFEAAGALAPGAVLHVLVSFRPVPLIEKLESHGYQCELGPAPDGRLLLSVHK